MADAPDLGSGGATRGGSSPLARTNIILQTAGLRPAVCFCQGRIPRILAGYEVEMRYFAFFSQEEIHGKGKHKVRRNK